jgi:hypothetical protein
MLPTRKIVGNGWTIQANAAELTYESSGDARTVLGMVESEFPSHEAIPLYSTQFESGDSAGHLPEAIVAFLGRWGIEARLEPEHLSAKITDPDTLV